MHKHKYNLALARLNINYYISKGYLLIILTKGVRMPFPFKEKKSQFKDYKKFSTTDDLGVKCTFFARDDKDAELYINKLRNTNAKNESSSS